MSVRMRRYLRCLCKNAKRMKEVVDYLRTSKRMFIEAYSWMIEVTVFLQQSMVVGAEEQKCPL